MRVDFIHADGRECWAVFEQGELIQLACKSLDLRMILRGPEWAASGLHGYTWHHWPLEGELALYAYKIMMKEMDDGPEVRTP